MACLQRVVRLFSERLRPTPLTRTVARRRADGTFLAAELATTTDPHRALAFATSELAERFLEAHACEPGGWQVVGVAGSGCHPVAA